MKEPFDRISEGVVYQLVRRAKEPRGKFLDENRKYLTVGDHLYRRIDDGAKNYELMVGVFSRRENVGR